MVDQDDELSDPVKNCALEVCCGAAAAVEALASLLVSRGLCAEPAEAKRISRWMHKHFDFAEKGTLAPLKKSIARLAKA